MGKITRRLLFFLLVSALVVAVFVKIQWTETGNFLLTRSWAEEDETQSAESSTWSGKVTVTYSGSTDRIRDEAHEKGVTNSNATYHVKRLPFISKEHCSTCEADWEGIVTFSATFDQQSSRRSERCTSSLVVRGNGTGEAHMSLSCHEGVLSFDVGSISNYIDPRTGKEREVIQQYKARYHETACDGKEYKGERTVSPPFTRIGNERCDLKKGRISGTKTFRDGSSVKTITWDLALDSPDLEAVIVPHKDYHWWMPEAGKDEKTAGNHLEVTVKVQSKNEKKPSKQKAKFTFELIDVSKEPGVCMNWPRNGTDDFDFRIDDLDQELEVKNEGQWAQTKEHHKEFRIFVKSYDYGAYGKLRVKAETKDGRPISVRVEGQPDQDELIIPLDKNNNHIADKYEKDFDIPGNKAADSDEDFIPEGDKNRGDGVTLYEEYRGFMTKKNKHVRSDPAKKTLFIYSSVPHAEAGIKLFSKQSRIEVFEIDKEDQMNPSRVINYNHHYAHKTDQHGLKMVEENMETGTAGGTPLGPPKKVDSVRIQKDYEKVYSNSKTIAIAHELGHTVRMQHHGDGNYDCGQKGREYCMNAFARMKEECGNTPACERKYRGAKDFYIAVQQGENSGDENCIMRYIEAHYYEKGWANKTYHPYGKDRNPTTYCGVKGTNSKTGEATRGNCMGQICVSDKYH